MRKLFTFEMVSADGFFEGPHHELNWHMVDDEFHEFSELQLSETDLLLFGRVTYQLMASYWPTAQNDPGVKDKMNNTAKVVFSRTLSKVEWNKTTLFNGNVAAEVARLKKEPGKDIALLGSGEIASLLLKAGLIDEHRIMISPVVLGAGIPLFKNLERSYKLKLLKTRVFTSGNVLLCYQPDNEKIVH